MAADSVVYEVALAPHSGELRLTAGQRIRGQGAHGADAFNFDGERYVSIPSYYGCGSARGQASERCKSTLVLRLDRARGRLEEYLRLATSGPAQTVHFVTRHGELLVAVGENFNDEVCIYRGSSSSRGLALEKHQCLPVPGAGSMALAEAGDELILVASSYHDPATGWATRSRVFRADARAAAADVLFAESQRIDTFGCHDAELAWLGGDLLLFLSEDRAPHGTRIESKLLRWHAPSRSFVLLQRIPTDGAHASKLFQGPDGADYCFIANFGDRLGARYASRSTLWRRARHRAAQAQPFEFEFVAEVESQGATDAEHLVIEGRHFLALANEGDVRASLHQRSVVYELLLLDERDEL